MRKLSKKAQIKQDLLQQLEANSLYGMHYVDLVDDYMTMVDVKNKLAREIKKKGPSSKAAGQHAGCGSKKGCETPRRVQKCRSKPFTCTN